MVCRLCLEDSEDIIKIFDEVGKGLNVAFILEKYFWFQLQVDDPISASICNSCWIKVWDFHTFYKSIEEAHRDLTERYSISRTSQAYGGNINENTENKDILKEEKNATNWEYSFVQDDEMQIMQDSLKKSPKATSNPEASEDDSENRTIISELERNENDINTPALNENQSNALQSTILNTIFDSTANLVKNEEIENDCQLSSRFCISSMKMESRKLRKSKKDPPILDLDDINHSRKQWRSKEYDEKISNHMRLICDLCNVEMPTFSTLQHHFQHMHARKGYVICCNKKLYKRILLVDHINKHLDPEYFKCNDCKKVFADKQCLRNHLLIMHQPDKNKIFSCNFCPKRFVKRYLLEQHLPMHVPTEERKHICEICLKAFPNSTSLTSHRKNVHSSSYGTMCHICAKVIRGKDAFAKHQLEHSGVKIPEVQCEKCGSWLKDKYSLQKHMRRHNDEGSLHICNICGKKAPNQSALRSHFRYVHNSDRSYECSVCKKAFKKPLNLKEHMTIHTGEVLYSCPHCTKTFNSNANMHSHRKKMHPKEWEENRKHRKGKIAEIHTIGKNKMDDMTEAASP